MPQAWAEVNEYRAAFVGEPERLLVDLIDPLIHGTFAGRMEAWFFGWYSQPQQYHLRLRIRWRTLARANDDRAELFALLAAAQQEGRLAAWWDGNHGVAGEIYRDEADTYGDLWELSYKDWNSSSELVLAMAKRDPDNRPHGPVHHPGPHQH